MSDGSIRDVAGKYVEGGLSAVPVKADGSKAPVGAWKKHQEHRPSPYEIKQNFRGSVGVAILGGKVSGNLEIFDFDHPDYIEPWVKLVEENSAGLTAKLTRIKTPRGGAHFYYRCPEIEGNQKLAQEPTVDSTTGKPGAKVLIETRGEGGYVLAPGCPAACHPTGKLYEYVSGPELTKIQTITPDERKVLLDSARSFNRIPKQVKVHAPSGRKSGKGGLRPGDDFNLRATWDEVLTPHGWRSIKKQGDAVHWCRPGKDDSTTSATTGHCGDNFYVFSSNAHPFESDTAYSKFSAYTVLAHGGDFEAAAKELGGKGYGTKPEKKERRRDRGNADRYFEGREFLPERLAMELADKHEFIATPISNKGIGIWLNIYEGGVFRKGAEDLVVTEGRAALGEYSNKERLTKVTDNLLIAKKIHYEELNPKALDLINVKNGMLDWKNEKLLPHDKNYRSNIQINADWNPGVKCDAMDKFFETILPKDEIPLIEEYVGYLTIPDTSFGKCLVAVGEGGNGKALALDTPIPTPSGWTAQGALLPGDTVFDENGVPCQVTGISETWKNRLCYRLRFSDGSEIIADGKHEWQAINARHQKVCRRVTTEQIAKKVIMRERVIEKEIIRERLWGIQVTKPLQLPTADLPINPYVLGAWLGNGTSVASSLTFGEQDAQHYLSEFGRLGYHTKLHQYKPGAVRINVSPVAESRGRGRDSLKGRLRILGVLGQKHIPTSYLRASQDQRLALLQGLMDTDGSTLRTQAQCEFVSVTKALAENTFELVCSLGLRPTLTTGLAKLNGRIIGKKYRVIFTTLPGVDVFRLQRKASICRPRRSGLQRKIISCDLVPSVPVRCIQVDSLSHLYLCGRSMIPTHNSSFLKLLTTFIGKDNISNFSLHQIAEEKFSAAGLFGKLANFYDELESKAFESTGVFKQIVTGDSIKAEEKNERPFSFRPFCRLVFATNQMPRATDRSQAYFDRFIFARFMNRIRDSAIVIRKYDEVLAATPGALSRLLTRAVSGLQRLMAKGKFSHSDSSLEAIEDYRRECNSAYDFVRDCCTFDDPTGWISRRSFYETYKAWSVDQGRKPMSSREFIKVLRGLNVREIRHGEGVGWGGISWSNGTTPETSKKEVENFSQDTGKGQGDLDF